MLNINITVSNRHVLKIEEFGSFIGTFRCGFKPCFRFSEIFYSWNIENEKKMYVRVYRKFTKNSVFRGSTLSDPLMSPL